MTGTLIGGAFFSCLVSGLVPIVNGEVVVAGAALAAKQGAALPLLIACASGQMLAKVALFVIARRSPDRLPKRAQAALARASGLWQSRSRATLVVLTSAGVGLPPFYVVTLAAGALRVPASVFVLAGTAGTVARYGAIVWGATRLV